MASERSQLRLLVLATLDLPFGNGNLWPDATNGPGNGRAVAHGRIDAKRWVELWPEMLMGVTGTMNGAAAIAAAPAPTAAVSATCAVALTIRRPAALIAAAGATASAGQSKRSEMPVSRRDRVGRPPRCA